MGYLVRVPIPDGQSNLLNRWLVAACHPLHPKGEYKQKRVTCQMRVTLCFYFCILGAGCRTRTRHLMITNQLLYLMS